MLRRIAAFVRGDMAAAENLGDLPDVPQVDWIQAASLAGDATTAEYAREAAERSATDANESVKGLQDKAAGFLTLLVGLVPLLIAAIALTAPAGQDNWARWLALGLLLAGGASLIGAIVMAALASGLTLGGGLNLERLNTGGGSTSIPELKAAEADAWHHAAMLAMEASTRKARDLFRSRQLAIVALTLSIAGTAVLLMSVGGDLGGLTPATGSPTPTPSISSGPDESH